MITIILVAYVSRLNCIYTQAMQTQSSAINFTIPTIISIVRLVFVAIMEFKCALLMVISHVISLYDALCINNNDCYPQDLKRSAQGKIDICVNCRYICVMTPSKITIDYVIDMTHSWNATVDKNIKIDAFYINNMFIKLLFVELGLLLALIVTMLNVIAFMLNRMNHSSIGIIIFNHVEFQLYGV